MSISNIHTAYGVPKTTLSRWIRSGHLHARQTKAGDFTVTRANLANCLPFWQFVRRSIR